MTGDHRPPWRLHPRSGELHLIDQESAELTIALCGLRAPTAAFTDPLIQSDPACTKCIRAWAAMVSTPGALS